MEYQNPTQVICAMLDELIASMQEQDEKLKKAYADLKEAGKLLGIDID